MQTNQIGHIWRTNHHSLTGIWLKSPEADESESRLGNEDRAEGIGKYDSNHNQANEDECDTDEAEHKHDQTTTRVEDQEESY